LARKGARGKISIKLRITQKPQYFPAHLNNPSKNLHNLKWIYLFRETRE